MYNIKNDIINSWYTIYKFCNMPNDEVVVPHHFLPLARRWRENHVFSTLNIGFHTVDGSDNPVNSPVEVGTLSYLQMFSYIQVD